MIPVKSCHTQTLSASPVALYVTICPIKDCTRSLQHSFRSYHMMEGPTSPDVFIVVISCFYCSQILQLIWKSLHRVGWGTWLLLFLPPFLLIVPLSHRQTIFHHYHDHHHHCSRVRLPCLHPFSWSWFPPHLIFASFCMPTHLEACKLLIEEPKVRKVCNINLVHTGCFFTLGLP